MVQSITIGHTTPYMRQIGSAWVCFKEGNLLCRDARKED